MEAIHTTETMQIFRKMFPPIQKSSLRYHSAEKNCCETVGALFLDFDIAIFVSDFGRIECVDCSRIPTEPLWQRKVGEEEFKRLEGFDYDRYRHYLYDYTFWDEYLKGAIDLSMFDTCTQELMKQYQNSTMFTDCADKVQKAWKRTEAKLKFQGLGINEDKQTPQYLSEYAKQMIEHMEQGLSPHVLGNTVDSAAVMAKRAIESIDKMYFENTTGAYRNVKLQEKAFYYQFLEFLNGMAIPNPLQMLLHFKVKKE